MPKALKTGWMIIGRSGPTIDNRTIEPIALEQAAKNYKKDLFTALIWPDHLRWFNMGTVEALKTARNNEGGVDLLAILAPNDYYLVNNANGQRLFTSMELMPNFRDSGEWYLTGLAATDSPASAATSEMRFSSLTSKDALISQFTEQTPQVSPIEPESFARRFAEIFDQIFNPTDETPMTPEEKAQLNALNSKFEALEKKLESVLKLSEKPTDSPEDKTTTLKPEAISSFTELSAKIDTLMEAFKKTTEPTTPKEEPAADPQADRFTKMADDLKKLTEAFNAAVKHKGGTNAGEQLGNANDLSQYL